MVLQSRSNPFKSFKKLTYICERFSILKVDSPSLHRLSTKSCPSMGYFVISIDRNFLKYLRYSAKLFISVWIIHRENKWILFLLELTSLKTLRGLLGRVNIHHKPCVDTFFPALPLIVWGDQWWVTKSANFVRSSSLAALTVRCIQ